VSPFESVADFQRRAGLSREELRAVARAGALQGLANHRREALWRVQEPVEEDLFSLAAKRQTPSPGIAPMPSMDSISDCPLVPMTRSERLSADYETTQVTVGAHPVEFLRAQHPDAWTAMEVKQAAHGVRLETVGMVICRQRPGTAKGFVFLSLEDETGVSNIVIAPQLYEQTRLVIAEEAFLRIEGVIQQHEGVTHLRAMRVRAVQTTVPASGSHDFH